MKKLLLLIISLSMLLSLCSCGKYVSSYSAVGLTKTQTQHSCKLSFLSLDGQVVFQLKKTDSAEGEISYSVSVSEGEVSVYYDISDEKAELVKVKSGETKNGKGGYVESGKNVYIIIEAKDAKGEVSIDLNS